MAAPLIGVAALVTYSSIVIYHYLRPFLCDILQSDESHEVVVLYRNMIPICLGVLHTSGNVLFPGQCTKRNAQYHLSFAEVTQNIAVEFPTENVHEVVWFNMVKPADEFGLKVIKLELDQYLVKHHIRYPLAKHSNASTPAYIHLGWFDNAINPTKQICKLSLNSSTIYLDTPSCLTDQVWMPNYKLGTIDFTFHPGQLEIYSLNAPAL